jgi:hypothetical protein
MKHGMPYVVRVSDEGAANELVETLAQTSTKLRRRGARTIEVAAADEDLWTELNFFLRAWALSHPEVEIELDSR